MIGNFLLGLVGYGFASFTAIVGFVCIGMVVLDKEPKGWSLQYMIVSTFFLSLSFISTWLTKVATGM